MSVQVDQWLRESSDPSIIDQAGRDGNALTIWHRQPEPDLQAAVAAIPHAALPDDRRSGPLEAFTAWIDAYLTGLPPAHRDDMAVIADDMLELARLFDHRLEASAYTFRCHRLNDTMCPRFHTDQGSMRLLCTYRGPGTEWVPEHAVDHRALQKRGTDNRAIVPDPSLVRSIPPFAAAVLCGCDRDGRGGVVHRSPAVPEGVSRLAFCMTLKDS